jgi:two-component system, NtrC family, nitrogen regulation sensor histidine kinase NtrY
MDEIGITCSSKVFPPDLMITADPDLIDQVIINLMLNAIDAVKEVENPKISVVATMNSSTRVIIDFHDNGSGIKPDIMDKIFMPFFTSKKHGNGIGLSLSRQIMHLHKGSIIVKSKPEEGTVFTLVF